MMWTNKRPGYEPIVLVTRSGLLWLVITAAVLLFGRGQSSSANAPRENNAASSPSDPAVDLSPSQLNSIKIESVGTFRFDVEKEAVGNISYADDLSVDVFPPYQGTVVKALVELGAQVQRDQPLYTIKSPDLIQAESTPIADAATFELTTKELARAAATTICLRGDCSKKVKKVQPETVLETEESVPADNHRPDSSNSGVGILDDRAG